MSKLVEYLLQLAADPDQCARFKADPESELRATTLSEREKKVLATRDPRKICEEINGQNSESGIMLQWLFSMLNDSGD